VIERRRHLFACAAALSLLLFLAAVSLPAGAATTAASVSGKQLPKELAGLVETNGVVGLGSGFTASRLGTGSYELLFPAGARSGGSSPHPVVVTAAASGDVGAAVTSDTKMANGSSVVTIKTVDYAGNPVDTAFFFDAGPSKEKTTPSGRVVTGVVTTTGKVSSGTGFSIVHSGVGQYTITFPAKTFNGTAWLPAFVATSSTVGVRCVVYSDATSADGSATIVVWTFNTSVPGTPTDTGFSFTASQGQAP
jgi:hypothetical protein